MRRAIALLAMLCCTFSGLSHAQSLEQIEAYERRINEQQQQLDAMREELEALKNMPGRKLSSGTIAIQGHDPKSTTYYKDLFIRTLP